MTAQPVAVDTSVAVALVVKTHPRHEAVRVWARGRELRLVGQAAVETYSVLTRLPGDLGADPATAIEVMEAAFGEVLPLKAKTAAVAHRLLADKRIAGGAVYDGLVALAAQEHHLALATRDERARPTYAALGVTVVIVR